MSREAHVPFYERPRVQLPRPTHRTEIGAEHVATIQSLIVTCKLHGIHAYDYLVDVLQRIDRHPGKDIDQLTPRLWKQHFADDPLRSVLHRQGP
jgi:transposase